jgi:ribosomal-protein-alanine N-acetyltransferase
MTILTPRLELRNGTRELYAIAPDDRESLAAALGVTVPENWPVEHYDDEALTWWARALDDDASVAPWLSRYFIELESNTLIGFGGGGRPVEGAWTIGYSVLPQFRRRGYASEAVQALLEFAFADASIERVIAETYPELVASVGVLQKSGFVHIGDGEGERVIRFERRRR